MVFRSLEKIFTRFLRRGERFLIVEIEDNSLSVSKASVHWQDKKLKVLNKWTYNAGWTNDTAKAFSFLQKILKRIPRLAAHKIILVLEPRLATTIHVSTKIIRDEGRKIIDEVDLDNLISQAIWQVFDRERSRIADKMALDDLDVLLVDVKIRNLKIDGHRVVNPLGFSAKTTEVFLSQTFASRDFFETMRVLFPRNQFVFISEAGAMGADILARLSSEKNKDLRAFALVNLNSARSDVYGALIGENCVDKIWYLDNLNLGRNDFYANFGKHFMVQASVAENVIKRYAGGEVSSELANKLERLMRKEWVVFCDGLASIVSDSRDFKHAKNAAVFLRAEENLPEIFYSETLRLRDGKKMEIMPVVFRDIISRSGFKIIAKKHKCSFFTAAGILALYYYSDEWLNKIANRRLRWLMPREKHRLT